MYLIINSSKGISSVYLGKLVGISQKSSRKLGHAGDNSNLDIDSSVYDYNQFKAFCRLHFPEICVHQTASLDRL